MKVFNVYERTSRGIYLRRQYTTREEAEKLAKFIGKRASIQERIR